MTEPRIGIFWVYKGTVIGRARPLIECEENVPGLLDSPDSHIGLWEQTPDFVIPFPELRGVEYQSVPRGRVLYSTTEKTAIVYLDAALHTPQAQRAIRNFFQLEESAVSWKTDAHYTTSPELLDDMF